MQARGGPDHWRGMAETFARSYAALCRGTVRPVLDAAGFGTGVPPRRLLDVGTGTGSVAARAGDLGAEVTAVDPQPDMCERAARAAPSARVVAGSLPGLPFDDAAFDAVVANFVLNHVPDPWAAARELHRVAAPGGRAAVTLWPTDRDELDDAWTAVAAAVGATWPPRPDLPPERDVERTPAGVRALLDAAGFVAVDVAEPRWTAHVDPEALWQGSATPVSRIGRLVVARTAAEQATMKRAFDAWAAPRRGGDGRLALSLSAVLGSGTRMGS